MEQHKCDKCNKVFDWLFEFSRYGHDNPLKTQEALKHSSYCEQCFEIKNEELEEVMVYKDK